VATENLTDYCAMKQNFIRPEDETLRALLRGSRPAPTLPPRFEENVWRRIEQAESTDASWLDAMAHWLMRPKLALAAVVVVVTVGIGLGWRDGQQLARHDAQARYLAAVAPSSLR
jgi:hypothetical protein